ncbi:hypothetical protein J3R82DRAFT_9779 [Butyriboletus roseoflavus]|nr:hypothetical protein J3R82DRAFT_9779 [Butyriboletus roseoflavus]
MLKRAGQEHNPTGVDNTKEGACTDKAQKNKEWFYTLFVTINANFHLKWKINSKDELDPSLNRGWSYFVEELSYKLYLRDQSNSSRGYICSGHNAINGADTKSTVGLAAMGTRIVCCAHHEMKFAGSVGDLQKGERYVNMDYLFFSALRNMPVKHINVSYDIICQWECHLWE